MDWFLLKAALLAGLYFTLRILFRLVPFMHAVFMWGKKLMIEFLLAASKFVLQMFGFNSTSLGQVIYIEGSPAVKIINACIGWSIMSLFAAFIIAYPGNKNSKYWIIPIGIFTFLLANIARISLMAVISFKSPESLQFFHRYIFNFVLYLVVFVIWYVWIRKFGMK